MTTDIPAITEIAPSFTRSHQANVKEFHETFQIPRGVAASNRIPTDDDTLLRVRLLTEEFVEYVNAVLDGNFVEIADALADIDYIANGTTAVYGMDMDDLHEEVHASNMSKLDENGQPIFREDGKVLKGPGYFKPDLTSVLTADGGAVPEITPLTGDTRAEIGVIMLNALTTVMVKVEAIDALQAQSAAE